MFNFCVRKKEGNCKWNFQYNFVTVCVLKYYETNHNYSVFVEPLTIIFRDKYYIAVKRDQPLKYYDVNFEFELIMSKM